MKLNSLDSSQVRHNEQEKLWIRAFCTGDDPLPIVPAPDDRAWMNETKQGFANRCLPLRIANQAGWFILNTHSLQVSWDGGPEPSATKVACNGGSLASCPTSHFGHGIITWRIPYLFRTPPGFNLLVRGPTNWFKDGVAPLDGIVETDWAVATFTMNWKITRPNATIRFDPGDPICMIIPQLRGQLEQFFPQMRDMNSDADIKRAHDEWAASRAEFLLNLQVPESEAAELRWQKHYFRGTAPSGVRAPEHQVKLHLRAFSPDLPARLRVRSESSAAHRPIEEVPKMKTDSATVRGSDQTLANEPSGGESSPIPSLSSGYLTVSDFFAFASSMRSEFETHFSDPYGRYGTPQEIWDYWYVPDMYTYLRTDPRKVFSPDLVDSFLEALSIWSLRTLGLAKVSRPYLSLYVNGCGQALHNDSSNGRFGYVFSLTDWGSRHFIGGETLIFRDAPYWGSPRIAVSGAGTEFYELIPSLFNQLLLFDDRLIHAVRPIQGNMDPKDGRLVLHGHISEGGILAEGALGQQEVDERFTTVAPELLSDVTKLNELQGFLTARLTIQPDGKIEDVKALCNRIVPISSSAPNPSDVVSDILRRLARITFPKSSGTTAVTVPILL